MKKTNNSSHNKKSNNYDFTNNDNIVKNSFYNIDWGKNSNTTISSDKINDNKFYWN
jgi:hypothetical protein